MMKNFLRTFEWKMKSDMKMETEKYNIELLLKIDY